MTEEGTAMLVRVGGEFTVHGTFDLDAETDRVMDALLDLEEQSGGRMFDPDVAAVINTREVEVSVIINASSLEDAEAFGMELINSAISTAHEGASGEQFEGTRRAAELIAA